MAFVSADRVLNVNGNYSAIYITGVIPIRKVIAERIAAEKAAEMKQLK